MITSTRSWVILLSVTIIGLIITYYLSKKKGFPNAN